MRKSPRFLPILVSLSMLFLATPVLAAGYTCPESKKYTSCNAGYYMNNANVGNACIACSTQKNTTDSQACSTSTTITGGTRVSSGTQPCTSNYVTGTGSNGTAAQIGIGTCTGCTQWGTCTYSAYECKCDTGYNVVNQYSASCSCELACTNTCTSIPNTTSTQACTPTNTVSNAKTTTCPPGTQTCNGNYTGGNNCNGGSCSGCSSWGACSTSCKATSCNANYYLNNGACTACDTGFTAPDGNTGGASSCTKRCTKTCAGNNTAQCPANATCTYDTASTTSGTQTQGGECDAPVGLCPMLDFTCNDGYVKNAEGTACVATRCPAGYYLEDGACLACNEGFTTSNNNTSGVSSCTKYCNIPCNENKPCPAHSTCTHTTNWSRQWQISQTAHPDGDCGITGTEIVQCPVDKFTCDEGYMERSGTCVVISVTCAAGKYLPKGWSSCSTCTDGNWCPGGTFDYNTTTDQGLNACPERPGGGEIHSSAPYSSAANCMSTCPEPEKVEHGTWDYFKGYVVYNVDSGTYAWCQYELTCDDGYIEMTGPSGATVCQIGGRTLYLDNQGADSAPGIESAYLMGGQGWFTDEKRGTSLSGIGTLPTKAGYIFGGYYSGKNGTGTQIINESGAFAELSIPGTGALLYAYWKPGTWTCTAGTYYANGVGCLTCNPNHYCPGGDFVTDGGDQGLNPCANLESGFWNTSAAGGASPNSCYHTCVEHSIEYGTAIPVEPQAFYPATCNFTGLSVTGNPCDIVNGRCVEKTCNSGFEMIDGVCMACVRENATAYTGNCQITSCIQGYHPNAGGLECVDDVRECLPPNAERAIQTWNPKIQAFGGCVILECVDGYHVSESANACVLDEQTCTVEHGVGTKEWDSITNTWGKCVATHCDPGYTNDPSETNDTAAACGRCRNYYSILGTPAASSYVRECEIASCMYQGELYILRDNECEPICDINGREDDTGYMKWNPKTGKCDRSCKAGYSMW